jgi:uncharacterized membrane protein YkgB
MKLREMGHRLEWPIEILSEIELRLGAWMEKHGLFLLRVGMGIVFFWFGALKFLGMSPAAALVVKTMSWLPIPGFIHILGVWEMTIGLCFIYKPLLRVALMLLFLHMPGTFLPIVLLPGEVFRAFPFVLTLEGQYIVKNLVVIAAAIVIGGKICHQMQGLMRFPLRNSRRSCTAAPGRSPSVAKSSSSRARPSTECSSFTAVALPSASTARRWHSARAVSLSVKSVTLPKPRRPRRSKSSSPRSTSSGRDRSSKRCWKKSLRSTTPCCPA